MRRREFLLGCAAAACPFSARAQAPVVGFISSGGAADSANLAAASVRGLKEAGYVEGQNVTMEYRWAEGRYDRLPSLAADLVGRKVSVIIAAGGSDPARVAKAATATIPIVFITAADPVLTGLVTNLSRPEGNVTGISMVGATLEAKRLALLHQLVPRASAVGVLVNPSYPAAKAQTQEVENVTAGLGVRLVLRNARTEAEIDAAFADFVREKIGALLLANDPFLGSQRGKLAELALRHGLPAMSFRREFAAAGGLLSYGADFENGYREAGVYAGRILKGAKTTDLPVVQPTRFQLVINLKAARALGIDLPPMILAQADELIE